MSVVLAGALVAACSGAAAPQAPVADLAAAPAAPAAPATPAAATPVPTPKNITPGATPLVMTDGQGAEVVRGVATGGGLIEDYTMTTVGDVDQYRGGVEGFTERMNDPRVDGTGTFEFAADAYGVPGIEWGKMTVVNRNGSWEGPCSGAHWRQENGEETRDGVAWSCWLAGSGDYEGYTYYKQTSMDMEDNSHLDVVGVVYPGEPPKER
jgi:hypothetical protein